MIKKISDWWYNRNKPYYMLPRGKDIGEPITTVVEDFLANRSRYHLDASGSGSIVIRDKRSVLSYKIGGANCRVFTGLETNGSYKTCSWLTQTEDEKEYLRNLTKGLWERQSRLESCHKEWSEKTDRKRLTKIIKECL